MERVAKFYRVSLYQYAKDRASSFIEWDDMVHNAKNGNVTTGEIIERFPFILDEWNNIRLPERATSGSAGYDFFLPVGIDGYRKMIPCGANVRIPTGVRCQIKDGWVLNLYPRSGLGTKYGIRLCNTVGIIDSDYFNADNEGHIQCFLQSGTNCELHHGDRFCQGIFLPFGITTDDDINKERTGGFGSTGK